MRLRFKEAGGIASVGAALVVAGGVLLSLSTSVHDLHVLGWTLLGFGIGLILMGALWVPFAWVRPLGDPLLSLLRGLRDLAASAVAVVAEWSPLAWRGFPGSARRRRVVPPSPIHYAVYYTPNVEKDVTEIVRDLVDADQHLCFTVSNERLGGDPDGGVVKNFRIEYELVTGLLRQKTFVEGDTVDLDLTQP